MLDFKVLCLGIPLALWIHFKFPKARTVAFAIVGFYLQMCNPFINWWILCLLSLIGYFAYLVCGEKKSKLRFPFVCLLLLCFFWMQHTCIHTELPITEYLPWMLITSGMILNMLSAVLRPVSLLPYTGFVSYLAQVTFFPLAIGGIPLYSNLYSEMNPKPEINRSFNGMICSVLGLFKAIVVSERLLLLSENIQTMKITESLPQWISLGCWVLGIYMILSGMSDLSYGICEILDIHILQNFNTPFSSLRMREFCRHWFSSVSLWIRRNLIVPLLQKTEQKSKYLYSTVILWMITTLWYGFRFQHIVAGLWVVLVILLESKIELKDGFLFRVLYKLCLQFLMLPVWILAWSDSIFDFFERTKLLFSLQNFWNSDMNYLLKCYGLWIIFGVLLSSRYMLIFYRKHFKDKPTSVFRSLLLFLCIGMLYVISLLWLL